MSVASSWMGFKYANDGVPIMIDAELDPISRVPQDSVGVPVGYESVPTEVVRPIFPREDYVIVRHKQWENYVCPTHNIVHRYYTHGCQPAAMAKNMFSGGEDEDFEVFPAPDDSVPHGVFKDCKFDRHEPHEHKDFRWQ